MCCKVGKGKALFSLLHLYFYFFIMCPIFQSQMPVNVLSHPGHCNYSLKSKGTGLLLAPVFVTYLYVLQLQTFHLMSILE